MGKLTLREIRRSLGRFLAIAAIVALGVGFFCGLRLTKTAMVRTLDAYAEAQQMYDFRLVSTIGFDETDAAKIAADSRVGRRAAGMQISVAARDARPAEPEGRTAAADGGRVSGRRDAVLGTGSRAEDRALGGE